MPPALECQGIQHKCEAPLCKSQKEAGNNRERGERNTEEGETADLWENQPYPTQKRRKKRINIHAFHAHCGIVFSQPVFS